MVVVRAAFAIALCTAGAAAQQVNVTVETEYQPVTAGEVFTISVNIDGAASGYVTFPEVDNLTVDSKPSGHNSVVQFVNGRRSQLTTQYFRAQIEKPGTVELPPVTVTIAGRKFESAPLTIRAVEQAEHEGPTLADGIRIESRVDKTEVYEGEAIQLTFEIWELQQVSLQGVTQFPQTVGFYAIPQEPEAIGVEGRQRDGMKYRVTRSGQMLYPTRAGGLTIEPFQWSGIVAGYAYINGRRRPIRDEFIRRTEPIDITVKPLPEHPDGFSGAVGTYSIQGGLSGDQVDQGVPVKLSLQIKGRGNPRAVAAPEIPDLEWAHVGSAMRHDDAPQRAIEGIVDQRFEYAITPHDPGQHTIPAIAFVYFNPELENYETETAGPFKLSVFTAGEPDQSVVYDGSEEQRIETIDILSSDILPVVTAPRNLRRSGRGAIWGWAIGVLPVATYAVAAGYTARRRRFDSDHAYARQYRARSEAQRRLHSVHDSSSPEQTLHDAVVHYVADRFNVNGAGMTAHDADLVLRERGCDGELCRNVQTILRKCERAVYSSQSLPEAELNALAHGAAAAIDQIEAHGKKKK